jgi:L-galactose dehydrogenase
MQLSPLGNTGLDVAPVALGTGPLGEMFGPAPLDEAVRVVQGAIDLGVNLIDTAPMYLSAEERLGVALRGRRDRVILATKTGRFPGDDFDFSPERIRTSLENSLRLLGTDHVDVLHLHDIEWVPLDPLFDDSMAAMQELRDAGKVRFLGVTGYALPAMERAIHETDIDVLLTFAHGTLLDDSLAERILPIAAERGVGVMNAAALALGILAPHGTNMPGRHPAPEDVQRTAEAMRALAADRGIDLAFLANQYSIQRSGAATTVVGTAKLAHLESAVRAADTPIDEELLDAVLALRPPRPKGASAAQGQWQLGLPENRDPVS